ncbi:hypothetical protein [Streptomyces sp. H39-S7]|uniref:hypothetical protein n=1 Tax=Streptomyces sp. H39-S7 TaxID=3004357 RepID=UPI0022AFFF86|nr:hypothetical protein [Streptomyces sp. H39-S7]MCZ4125441.1 hypothetical protein [Streptomyces sp. H39-S7]
MSTATTTGDSEELVGRCYTEARRLPVAIGRFSSGGRMLGGPYTMTQLAVMVGSFVLLVVTRPLWGTHLALDALVVLAVPFVAGWAVARVQIDHRNPLAALVSLAGRTGAPAAGRMHGRPYRQRPARRIAPVATVDFTAAVEPETAAPEPDTERPPVLPARPHRPQPGTPPAPVGTSPGLVPVVSGVQALLAQRAARAREGAHL